MKGFWATFIFMSKLLKNTNLVVFKGRGVYIQVGGAESCCIWFMLYMCMREVNSPKSALSYHNIISHEMDPQFPWPIGYLLEHPPWSTCSLPKSGKLILNRIHAQDRETSLPASLDVHCELPHIPQSHKHGKVDKRTSQPYVIYIEAFVYLSAPVLYICSQGHQQVRVTMKPFISSALVIISPKSQRHGRWNYRVLR